MICRRQQKNMIQPPNASPPKKSRAVESLSISYLAPALFRNEFQIPNKSVILKDVFNETGLYIAMSDTDTLPADPLVEQGLQKINVQTGLRRKRLKDRHLNTLPRGHVDHLHFSGQDETLMQFRGKNSVSLFPPSVSRDLYPSKRWLDSSAARFSQVDIDSPDFIKFPRLQIALQEQHTVHLEVGQTLYIPVGWWYEVRATRLGGICSLQSAWRVDPIWRYSTCPQAAYLCGISALTRLTR